MKKLLIVSFFSTCLYADIPEVEIQNIETSLSNLNQQFSTHHDEDDVSLPLKYSIRESKFWLKKEKWRTVIALLQDKHFQKFENQLYRLYSLGRSYESINKEKSLYYYEQYLNISQQNLEKSKDFLAVVEAIIKITPSQQQGQKISSILSLDLKKDMKHSLLLLTSTLAISQSKLEISRQWLEKIAREEPTAQNLAQSLYFLGIIASLQRRYSDATSLFDSVLGIDSQKIKMWHDRSTLALGYIYQDQKKYHKAANLYAKIGSSSPFYPKSLENHAFMLIKLKQYHLAIPALEKRLTFPTQHVRFRKLLSWIDLQIGNPEKSKSSIKSLRSEIQQDRNNILNTLSLPVINRKQFSTLSEIIDKWFPDTKEIMKLKSYFHKISIKEKELFSLHTRLQNIEALLLYLGPERILQHTKNRQFQLSNLSHHAATQGTSFIKNTIKQIQPQVPRSQLEKFENRRKSRLTILREKNTIQDSYNKWGHLEKSFIYFQKAANLKQRLENIEAKISGIHLQYKKDKTLYNNSEKIISYLNATHDLRRKNHDLLRKSRDHHLQSWSKATSLDSLTKKSFYLFKNIEEDWQKISTIIASDRTPLGTLRYKKNIQVHQQWSFLAGKILEDLSDMKDSKNIKILEILNKKEGFRRRIRDLEKTMSLSLSKLEKKTSVILSYLKPRFVSRFRKLESDLIKWEGDIEYQKALKIANKKQKTQNSIKLEEEILRPSLDLRGVPL